MPRQFHSDSIAIPQKFAKKDGVDPGSLADEAALSRPRRDDGARLRVFPVETDTQPLSI